MNGFAKCHNIFQVTKTKEKKQQLGDNYIYKI